MFLRTSEFDAGFGVQPTTLPRTQRAERLVAPPWRRAVRAIGRLAGRIIGADRRRRPRPAWLDPDLMSDHMLSDLGFSRDGFGPPNHGDPLRNWNGTGWRR